jgi:hypothetical protein
MEKIVEIVSCSGVDSRPTHVEMTESPLGRNRWFLGRVAPLASHPPRSTKGARAAAEGARMRRCGSLLAHPRRPPRLRPRAVAPPRPPCKPSPPHPGGAGAGGGAGTTLPNAVPRQLDGVASSPAAAYARPCPCRCGRELASPAAMSRRRRVVPLPCRSIAAGAPLAPPCPSVPPRALAWACRSRRGRPCARPYTRCARLGSHARATSAW